MLIALLWVFIVVGAVCGLLLYIGPRGWITTAKSEALKALLQGRPPPWQWLNEFGKGVYIMMFACAAGVLLVTAIGWYFE